MCDCVTGQNGRICKHQVIAAEVSSQPLPQQFHASHEQRRELTFVALGDVQVHEDFFMNVHDAPGPSSSSIMLGSKSQVLNNKAASTSDPMPEQCVGQSHEDDDDMDDFASPANTKLTDDQITSFLNGMKQVLQTYGNKETTTLAIAKAQRRLSKISTTSQLDSLLHTMGSDMITRVGGRAKIPCTPAAIARRQDGMPRGRATIGRGKRPNELPSKTQTKRKRNIGLAISNNHSNGYTH